MSEERERKTMCGRVIQLSNPDAIRKLFEAAGTAPNAPPRYNGAPAQDLMVVRKHPKTGDRVLDMLRWGLIPYWVEDPKGGRKPILARSESAPTSPTFRGALEKRRGILPVDGFFEWKGEKGAKNRQPYAVMMKDRSPFGIAVIWENWKDPSTEAWLRTFAVLTCPSNALMATIHDRMPVILEPGDYDRWLGADPDVEALMVPYASEKMMLYPVSTAVNSYLNDTPEVMEPLAAA
ncbi:MAG: SOS response-associated peptidase [Bauldia sp.]|nr:SOS response-associated peptidase [Bauldia sp.]